MNSSPQGPYSPIYSTEKAKEMVGYYRSNMKSQYRFSEGWYAYKEMVKAWIDYYRNKSNQYRQR